MGILGRAPGATSSTPVLGPERPLASLGEKPVARADTWTDLITGIGSAGIDKTVGTARVDFEPLPQAQAELYWRCDDIMGRVVETIPREMTREGHDLTVPDDIEQAEEVENLAEELGIEGAAEEALQYASAFGGGGVLIGLDDGTDFDNGGLAEPVDLKKVKGVKYLTPLTPLELRVRRYYSSPFWPKYGWPEVYDLVPYATPLSYGNNTSARDLAGLTAITPIHESRIWRFDGVRTTRRARLFNVQPGWSDSVLMRIVRIVQSFQLAWQGTGILLQDFAPATLKMKNLAKLVGSGVAGRADIAMRAQALELSRSIARVAVIDSEEEFERKAVSLTGLSDVLEQMMLRIAACANMPVGLLMGQSPAGLNATGDADIRWFYDQVKARQRTVLVPYYRWVYRHLFAATGGEPKVWRPVPRSLWQLSAKEQAAVKLQTAQTDAIYLDRQVVHPAEVARSRFGGDEFSTETTIDTGLRDELLADKERVAQELSAADPVSDPEDEDPEKEDPANPAEEADKKEASK